MGTKKRGNGQGSVYKMKNGKWRAEWTIGYKMDGSRISKRKGGFSTKKDAMKFLESEKSQPSYESINIQEVYKIISADIEKLSKDKQRAYDIAYRRIRPIWFRNISDIRIPELQYIVDTAPGDFYPKRDIKALLRKIFRYAVANDWVQKDYASYIKLPKCPEPKKETYTDIDIAIMWKNYNLFPVDSVERVILGGALIMIYTGMRTGELLSAKKKDIHVNERYMACGIKTSAGKQRHIPIAKKILPIVSELLLKCTERLIPLSENQFYEGYKETMGSIGVSSLTPGCCRHTFNTNMARAGIQPAIIQRASGHRSYQTTLGYTHIKIDDILSAVDKL